MRTVSGWHLATRSFATAVVHAAATTVLFAALFTARLERLLLLRADQALHFFLGLLVKLANLFLLLLRAQRRVRADGLNLRARIFFDLMVLLKRRLRDASDLPAGLLSLAASTALGIGTG